MAADEEVILGVDFEGQQGISAFLNAFDQIPAQVQAVLAKLNSVAGGGKVMQNRGQQIAQEFIKGTQAGLAGFGGFGGDQFGSSVLANAGLSPAQIRNSQSLVRSLNQVRADMTKAGSPITNDKQFTQATTLGLRGVELTARQSERAVAQLTAGLTQARQRLQGLQALTKDPTGVIDSSRQFLAGTPKSGVAWNGAATDFSRQASFALPGSPPTTDTGMPNQASARKFMQDSYNKQVTLQRQAVTTAEEQLRVTKTAPIMAPRAQEVARAVQGPIQGPSALPPSAMQRQIIQSRADGLSQRDAAVGSGATRYQVQKVDETYAVLIASLKQEAAEHRRVAAAAAQLARDQQQAAARVTQDQHQAATQVAQAQRRAVQAERQAISETAPNVDGMTYRQKSIIRGQQVAADEAARVQKLRQLGAVGTPQESARASDARDLAATRDDLFRSAHPGLYSSSAPALAVPGRVSFKDSVVSGFRGGDGENSKPFGEMVGQTARISLFYGTAYRALTLLQNGLTSTIAETLKYEQALTDLDIVTSRTRSSNTALAGTLSAIAVAAGFTPSSGVELGSKALGLYGVTQADKATQDRTIEVSSTVATRIARVSGGDPIATQTQLAGALRSLGWGIERLTELEDTITYISRNTGQSSMELLGAVSNIATLGTSAGFSPQQLAALVAQVGTTTGQNPESTAGQFRQLLSRSADTIAPKAGVIFNEDFSGKTIEQIFEAVSKKDVTTEQRTAFASLFGKGGSQQVAEILTQNWDRVNTLATDAQGASGIGRQVYDEAMSSIGNQLKRTGAAFTNFGISLVESGILDWVAAVVDGSRQLIEAGTQVLDLFNSLPRPLRGVGLALAEIYGAAVLFRRISGGTGALAAVAEAGAATGAGVLTRTAGSVAGGVAASTALQSLATRIYGIPAALRTMGNTPITRAGIADLFRGTGGGGNPFAQGALLGAGGPLRLGAEGRTNLGTGPIDRVKGATGLTGLGLGVAAAGALYVANTAKIIYENTDRAAKLMEGAQAASAMANSVEKMREASDQAATAATDMQKMGEPQVGDVMGLAASLYAKFTNSDAITEAQKLAAYNKKRANDLEIVQNNAKDARPDVAFNGDFSAEGMAAGMQSLKEHGYSATQQLAILNGALSQFADSAKGAAGAVAVIKPEQIDHVAGKIAPVGADAAKQVREAAKVQASNLADAHPPIFDNIFDVSGISSDAGKRKAQDAQAKIFDLSTDEQDAMQTAMRDIVVKDLNRFASGGISPEEVKTIIADATSASEGAVPRLAGASDEYKKLMGVFLSNKIRGALAEFGSIIPKPGELGAFLAVASANASASGQEARAEGGSEVTALQRELDGLMSSSRSGKGMSGATDDDLRWLTRFDLSINTAKRNLVNAKITEAHALVSYQQSFLKGDDVTGRLALESQSLQSALDMARGTFAMDQGTAQNLAYGQVRSGTFATQHDQITWPDNAGVRGLQIEMNTAAQNQAAEALAIRQNKAASLVSPGDSIGVARVQAENARAAMEALAPTGGAVPSSAYFGADTASAQASFAYTQASIQGVNTNALANIDPRAQTARLQQQVANAQREMKLYPKGDPQSGNLRDQITGLRQQLAQAVIGEVNSLASANIAGSRSQLSQASVAIANAGRTLSLQLAGTEAYNNALASLRAAQAQLAQTERDQADRILRLGSDLTDPVAQARLDTQKARDQLVADSSHGENVDVVGQDKLDLQGAQAREEAAAFSQRISDVQVAQDLGRVSHSQYLSYLQSEHDRLSSIAQRTRQQQEQLNQVDQLMKAASEQLQGQFNIGDIQLPTVYEVRRAMQSGAPTSVADYSHSNNQVTINGADFLQVIDWLQKTLGAGAQVVTATTARRV